MPLGTCKLYLLYKKKQEQTIDLLSPHQIIQLNLECDIGIICDLLRYVRLMREGAHRWL